MLALVFARSSTTASAFEPFRVDLDQKSTRETTPEIDHLLPIQSPLGPAPEFNYLLQYWAEITTDNYHYVVVTRDATNSRYYVEQGDVPQTELRGRPYHFKRRAEISRETVEVLCEYWVNMLLQTSYDRKALPYIPQVTVYMFSAFVAPIGRLHGCTMYPGVGENMPPYWMARAGEALYEFVTKSRNEGELRTRIIEQRDRYYAYMRNKDSEKK